jgi:hypothetical protein|uniref:NADH dehydrogenase subunit 4L n=1 Tax=Picea glauca TaxID=3330 RepID=A0A101LZW0_PICGL|nr:hypothetical protein ABT39_MTgene5400 [Picea glauca]QHR86032.1 hypothetical protein Q903MT_gene30 [Picea sitchensis]
MTLDMLLSLLHMLWVLLAMAMDLELHMDHLELDLAL